MATLTLPEERYAELFGPTPAYTPAGGWDNREPDRLVKTHCCFCGVQCGIQLKVKDNKVVGFEPWEEFRQSRDAVPQGCEAVSPKRTSGSVAESAAARRSRIPHRHLG